MPGTLTRFVIEGYREKCETKTVLGARFAKKPIELDIPVYITGMSFGALSLEAKMALAKGASMAGTATCSGEGGMIPPERDLSTKWYYQCIQSRYGFNPHHLMLADALRVLHRPGLQGRARRPPDGPEGDRAGRRDALAAAGDRPALAGAASRLARPGRPLAEDPGDPRGDRLPDPDPAQARRGARVRRRAHGGEVRAGHHLPRRRRGRHRRRPAPRDRGDRHPADGGDPRGAPRARGRRARRRDRPRRRGRHPQRRRRREVPRARREGGRDRPLGADGAQLQQGDPRRHRLRGHGRRSGGPVLPLPHRPLPGRDHDAGPGAAQAARRRGGGGARLQLPAHADARGADARARVRQDERALARAGGPLRADDGGRGDGEGAARRHGLHPRRHRGAGARRDRAPARAAPRVSGRLPARAAHGAASNETRGRSTPRPSPAAASRTRRTLRSSRTSTSSRRRRARTSTGSRTSSCSRRTACRPSSTATRTRS